VGSIALLSSLLTLWQSQRAYMLARCTQLNWHSHFSSDQLYQPRTAPFSSAQLRSAVFHHTLAGGVLGRAQNPLLSDNSQLSQLSDKLGAKIQPSPPGQPSVKEGSQQEKLGNSLQSLSRSSSN